MIDTSNYKKLVEKYIGKSIGNNFLQFSNGRDYEVIIYNKTIFRFPKNKEKDLNIQIEKKKLDIVSKYVNIEVPQYTIINNSYMVYPQIPGVPLDTISIGYTEEMISDIVNFLKQLHNIPLKEFSFLPQENKGSEKENNGLTIFVNKLKNKIETRLNNKIPQTAIKDILLYMDNLFFTYKSPIKRFIHGDIQSKNIIYNTKQKRISGIIDFTDSTIGGIELDFCNFYENDGILLNKFIKLYKGFNDKDFFERVLFLARRGVIFEIDNDNLFNNNFDYILKQLKKYKFLN